MAPARQARNLPRTKADRRGPKGWDLIPRFILFGSFLFTLVRAAFDDGRFHWTPAPSRVMSVGKVLLLAGYMGTACAQRGRAGMQDVKGDDKHLMADLLYSTSSYRWHVNIVISS